MEQFKAENYNQIGITNYYRSKDLNRIAIHVNCDKCNDKYYQLWMPFTFDCERCNEIKDLKKKNIELENKLSEKDKNVENLNKLLEKFRINEESGEIENLKKGSEEPNKSLELLSLSLEENKEKLQKIFNEKIELEKSLKEEIKAFKNTETTYYLQLETSKEEVEKLKKKLAELEIKLEKNQIMQSEIIETNEIDNKSENSDGFSSFD